MRGWPPHSLGQPRDQEAIRRSEGRLELASGQGSAHWQGALLEDAKMVDEADDMIMAMEEGREVDILQEVMRYSGLEAGERKTLLALRARA